MFPEMKWVLAMIFGCLLTGCTQEPTDIIREWKEDGWSLVTMLGKRGPIERTGVLRSEKAQMIEASWIEEGKRKTKLYKQSSHHYAVLRFFKKDGDEFVVIMRKRK